MKESELDRNAVELIGYTDRPGAAPGETISFHISTDAEEYEAQVVRLIQADESPEAPGYEEHEVVSSLDGTHAGTKQVGAMGSFMRVEHAEALELEAFTFAAFICPTVPGEGVAQTICSMGSTADGWAFGIDEDGLLGLWVGGRRCLTGGETRAWEWLSVAFSVDGDGGRASLAQRPLRPIPDDPTYTAIGGASEGRVRSTDKVPFLIAAAFDADAPQSAAAHFNGKVDSPRILSGFRPEGELAELVAADGSTGDVVAAWDLAREISSDRAFDTGPDALHGILLNAPGRAVTGYRWSGEEVDFRLVPEQYAAVHFHEDDLADLLWEESLRLEVPDWESGVYALRLRGEGQEDHIPFFVRPPRGSSKADVVYVIPTWTYLAYANEGFGVDVDFNEIGATDRDISWQPLDEYLREHPEFGLSCYDHHRDGSGVMYSSWRRPIVNIRPKYRWWLSGSAQYLSADLFVVAWLKSLGQDFDVVTDHDVEEEGLDLLNRYRVVITSSHPEYLSYRQMMAYRDYTEEGGRLMYLGGNGFYWVTTSDPQRPWLVEIRRGFFGTRVWTSRPGEEHHSMTGERGGLWRLRGHSPNTIVGNGFAAQGWDKKSPGYARRPGSEDPRAAWIFEGIEEQTIGDFGLIMGGAASDEIDRHDRELGSPPHSLVLATSGPHSRYYLQVTEDVPVSQAGIEGGVSPLVRADLVFFETPGDGAVFAAGSKGWVGSLAPHDFDNNVSKLTANVLRGFLERSFVAERPD